MKPKHLPSPRTVASSREAIPLATLFTVTHAAAQAPAPAAPEQKKKGEGNETLPEVKVTAAREGVYNPQNASSPKYTAPLLDTPQTISIIPKEVYNQQGARTLTDVLKNTPGITFNAGENGFSSSPANFSMRGTDTSGSIYVDGVRDSGNYFRDVFNIDSVEVAKGPAADNGRGGPAGYVNMVTKTPGLESFYSGTTSYSADEYASSGNFRTTFDLNQAIGNSPLEGTAVRLNALFQEGGVAGRDWAEKNSWGVAPSITIGLGTPTRFTLAYQHIEQNDLPEYGVPVAILPGFVNSAPGLSDRGLRDKFYGLKTDYDDVTSDSVLAVIQHDFANGLTLTNQTRFSYTDRDARFTVPTGYVAGTQSVTTQRQGFARENTSFSNQTNLGYEFETGSLKHTLATGIEYNYENSEADRFNTANAGNVSVFDPNPERSNPLLSSTQSSEVSIDTIAAYAYDTVEINSQWQLTGGIRLEHYRVDLDNNPATAAVPGFTKDETTVSGKLGVVYKPVENGSIYAAVGISSLPPASFLSNPDISREGDNGFPGAGVGMNSEDAKVQESINYEIGTKWNWCDDRITTTAAVFRTERHNVAMTGADTLGGTAYLQGYGEQIIQGIELGAAGKITEEWSVFGGVLFLDSERKYSDKLDQARQNANPGDYGTYDSTDGDELAFTPNYSANLWSTYRFPIGLTIGGGLQYVGSSYIGRPDDAERIIPNGQAGKIPDYVVFNALLAYEVNDNVTVRLNVDNVFDEVYAISTNWNGTRGALGAPRTYTISADWRF